MSESTIFLIIVVIGVGSFIIVPPFVSMMVDKFREYKLNKKE